MVVPTISSKLCECGSALKPPPSQLSGKSWVGEYSCGPEQQFSNKLWYDYVMWFDSYCGFNYLKSSVYIVFIIRKAV